MAPKGPRPRTVEEVFKDYRARRTALINALTRDADQVYDLCDPDKRESFCLYGLSDKTWEVTPPEEKVPTELPEPVLGINFGKEGMDRTKWLYLVAIHSDSWLLAVAFVNGCSLDCDQRKQLFNLMNDLPTVAEVVADHWKPDEEDKSTEDSVTNTRVITDIEDEEDEDEEDEDEGDEDEGDGEEEVEDEVSCVVQVENNPKFADEDDQNATYPLRKLSIMQPENEDKHNENEILFEGWGANYDGGL